ncbi:hypothetical protein BGX26_001461 [Mortierella sp. AD094]|nr:hypothetical protein BGX26_001461 [Mortierella sp. AD094]
MNFAKTKFDGIQMPVFCIPPYGERRLKTIRVPISRAADGTPIVLLSEIIRLVGTFDYIKNGDIPIPILDDSDGIMYIKYQDSHLTVILKGESDTRSRSTPGTPSHQSYDRQNQSDQHQHERGSASQVHASKLQEVTTTTTAREESSQNLNSVISSSSFQWSRSNFDKIQNELKARFKQSHEPHHNRIPQLYVILPEQDQGTLSRIFTRKFRLHLLCQCGGEGQAPYQFHLSNHLGYELCKPTELFRNYSPSILRGLLIAKYTLKSVSPFVPEIGESGIVDVIDDARTSLEALKATTDLASLIDETMAYIRGLQIDSADEWCTGDGFKSFEFLKGPDLRKFESYLENVDKGHALGDLYDVPMPNGEVRWVCIDHYRQYYPNYREGADRSLINWLQRNSARFVEENRKITISVASADKAKGFYKAMQDANGVLELDITLK